MSGTTHPTTQRHICEDRNPQWCWSFDDDVDYKTQNVGEMRQMHAVVGRTKFVGLRDVTVCTLSVAEMERRKEGKVGYI
jgi:hypothetical protein